MHYRLSVLLRRRPRQRSAVRERPRFYHSEPFKFFLSLCADTWRTALRPATKECWRIRTPRSHTGCCKLAISMYVKFSLFQFSEAIARQSLGEIARKAFFLLVLLPYQNDTILFFSVRHSHFHSNVSEIQIVVITLVFSPSLSLLCHLFFIRYVIFCH